MSDLPENWTTALIGDIIEFAPKNNVPDNTEAGFVPLHLMGKRFLDKHGFEKKRWSEIKKGYTHFADGDVLLARITPSFENGKGGLVEGLPNGIGAGSTEYFVCRPIKELLHPKYLLAFFKTTKFLKDGANVMQGAVGQQRVPKQYVLEHEIPLAPLDEQKRIAEKLDSLLTRVDSCERHLERVPQIIKRFRQSVLAAATSGRLTEDWREKQGKNVKPWLETIPEDGAPLPNDYERLGKIAFKLTIIDHSAKDLPETWSLLTIADLYNNKTLIDFADGNHGAMYPRKEDFGDKGALFLTATQIGENWEVDISACPRLRSDKAEKLVKGWARKNDVLLTHNATVGRVALLEFGEEDVLLGTSVTFYRFNEKYILPNYGRILFSSPFFQDQLKMEMAQTTRNQVPITKQVSFNFICPPIEEQAEIVRRVESLFAYAERLEARYLSASERVARLTPSLLAKGFRGELVEQDPNDESAVELLKDEG